MYKYLLREYLSKFLVYRFDQPEKKVKSEQETKIERFLYKTSIKSNNKQEKCCAKLLISEIDGDRHCPLHCMLWIVCPELPY